MNKHLTYEEWFNSFLDYEDAYKMYFNQQKEIDRLQQELQRKDNNWNELRKWLYEKEYSDSEYTKVLYKMEELEEK